jgi:hypothetical protein
LGLCAAIGILLSVGAANADTFTFAGTFNDNQVPLSGALDVEGGSVVGGTILYDGNGLVSFPIPSFDFHTMSFEQSDTAAVFSMNDMATDTEEIWLTLNFDLTTDIFTYETYLHMT